MPTRPASTSKAPRAFLAAPLQALASALALSLALSLVPVGPGASAQTAAGSVKAEAEAETAEAVYLYQVAAGDTLIGLGRRFMVDASRWPELVQANADSVRNPQRIAVGATLRIPLRLMRTERVPAVVTQVVGDVRTGAATAAPAAAVALVGVQPGQTVAEGSVISTGPDGHASIRLVDGTVLVLRPSSRLRVSESRRVPDAATVQSRTRLEQGRVEVEAAPAAAGRPGFKIDTPQGVLGVRGTEFRVGADAAQGVTRGEVLGGSVAVSGRPGATGQLVGAGFGTVVDATGQVAVPTRLLPPPDVSGLPTLQEQVLIRFALPALPGAGAYRAQLASDAAFTQVLAELRSEGTELRFAGVADGEYLLRVRGIDPQGLEGRDAVHRFRLKARPEAPLPTAPASRAVIVGGVVELGWAASSEASGYRLRIANDAEFKTGLRELGPLTALSARLTELAPGTYHWQLRSQRGDSDLGPWGAVRSFEMRPLPPAMPAPKLNDRKVGFEWEGRPGQSFEFQVARDAAFTILVQELTLLQPRVELDLSGSGRFYVRLRARDADGFLGPYTSSQYFDIINCVRDGSQACVSSGGASLILGY